METQYGLQWWLTAAVVVAGAIFLLLVRRPRRDVGGLPAPHFPHSHSSMREGVQGRTRTLEVADDIGFGFRSAVSEPLMRTGRHYLEVQVVNFHFAHGTCGFGIGIAPAAFDPNREAPLDRGKSNLLGDVGASSAFFDRRSGGWGYNAHLGGIWHRGEATFGDFGSLAFVKPGDILSLLLDLDAGTLTLFTNGAPSGSVVPPAPRPKLAHLRLDQAVEGWRWCVELHDYTHCAHIRQYDPRFLEDRLRRLRLRC